MKTNPAISFFAMFIGFSLLFSSQVIMAQDASGDKQVKVKIVQNINGETVVIEKVFSADDLEAIEDLLKEFDVNLSPDELPGTGQVEISIRKTTESSGNEDVTVDVEVTDDETVAEHAPRAFLGVFIETVEETDTDGGAATSELKGVRVTEVIQETAAEKIGLQAGDVITKVNGVEITDSGQFRKLIGSFKPGEEVSITYLREGKANAVKTALGETRMVREMRIIHPGGEKVGCHGMLPPMKFDMEDLKSRPFLGIVPEFSEESKQEGVLVKEVIEKSTAQELGLQSGDVIVEINDKAVTDFGSLREILASTKVGEEVKVEWTRSGQGMKASAPIKSKADYKELCIKLDSEKMAHCGDKWVKKIEYDFNGSKEEIRAHLENVIGHLELEMEQLTEQLRQLDEDVEQEVEEMKVTITIEDVATSSLTAKNLFFSPNPNNGTFNLSFELPEKGKTTIRIFDVSNKEIYEESLGKFSGRYEKQIDVSDNPKGIYFLQITQNGKSLNKKIVIQ